MARPIPLRAAPADLQVGAGFTWAHSDYVPNNIGGFAFYADYDLFGRYGVEANFHRVRDPNPDPLVPEQSLLRNHVRDWRPLSPPLLPRPVDSLRQGSLWPRRGELSAPINSLPLAASRPISTTSLTTSSPSAAAWIIDLNNRINLRADFEYQHWFASDRELPDGLAPYLFTFGGAYHFPARGPNK